MSKQSSISRFFKPVKKSESLDSLRTSQSITESTLGTSQETSICLDDLSDSELENDLEVQIATDESIVPDQEVDLTKIDRNDTDLNSKMDDFKVQLTEKKLASDTNDRIERTNRFSKQLDKIMKKRKLSFNVPTNDDENTDDDDESPEPTSKKSRNQGTDNLTPLDQQVQALKIENRDKLLVIRVGYKYKCFAEDAIVASKILHIKLIPGKLSIDGSNPADSKFKKFAYCSFPDIRLNVHLQRLIYHDLKVAVVEQSETTAIKKQSSNKSNVFERKIEKTFSKATYGINNSFAPSKGEKYMLGNTRSIWTIRLHYINQIQVRYSILSINLNSGDVIFDDFNDHINSTDKLYTRIRYLEPAECIITCNNGIPKELSKLFRKIGCTLVFHDINDAKCDEVMPDEEEEKINILLKSLPIQGHKIPDMKKQIHKLFTYLKDYKTEQCLLLSSNYKPFKSLLYMILDHNALENLDIFTNNGKKGSLFWLLDHTRTPFGSRELRTWILRPLINQNEIEARLDAIDCMAKVVSDIFFDSLNHILNNIPDLLHTLNRISYGSTSRKEVYFFLKQLTSLSEHFHLHSRYIKENFTSEASNIRVKSPYIAEIFSSIDEYFSEPKIPVLLSMINIAAVMDKDVNKQLTEFFNLNNYDNSDNIIKIQREIESVKEELNDELIQARKILKRPYLKYRNEIEYLVEVRNSQIKNLPSDWTKVNSTKAVSRFCTPTTSKLVEKLNYHKELLAKECNIEYKRFLGKINEEYSNIRNIVEKLARYDCILSLAATSCNLNYCRPIFHTNSENENQFIKVRNGRNPVIESLDITYVPNNIEMFQNSGRVNIITGPNMGGKSSYIRQVALLIIMAQIGSHVPAEYMELTLFDNILTRIGASDNILQGQSTFKIEMEDVLRCINQSTSKSLLLLDEVGRGTGTIDGKAISYALMKYFIEKKENCPLVLFTTHFPELGESINSNLLKNYYMDFVEEYRSGESWPSVTFLYNLKPGISHDSYGLNVAKLAHIDDGIIKRAYAISHELKLNENNDSDALKILLRFKNIVNTDFGSNTTNDLSTLQDFEKWLDTNIDLS